MIFYKFVLILKRGEFMKITIIDFNVKNDIKKTNYDGGKFPERLSRLIRGYHVNVVCLQEVNDNYKNKLRKFLPDFNFYGDNRFKRNSPWYKRCNENNSIITNLDVTEDRTYPLARRSKQGKRSFLSIFPRIATLVKLSNGLTIINTHLDHLSNIARKRQLEYLKQIVRENKNSPIILTGDFNLNTNDEIFEDFVIFMEACGSKLVPIETNTYKGAGNLWNPDHVFVPKKCKILNFQILDTALSDHRLILLEIE